MQAVRITTITRQAAAHLTQERKKVGGNVLRAICTRANQGKLEVARDESIVRNYSMGPTLSVEVSLIRGLG